MPRRHLLGLVRGEEDEADRASERATARQMNEGAVGTAPPSEKSFEAVQKRYDLGLSLNLQLFSTVRC